MSGDVATGAGAGALRGNRRRHRREAWIRRSLLGAAVLSIVVSAAIILSLIGNAFSFMQLIDLSNLVADGWFPRRAMFDLKTPIVASILISTMSMFVAGPLGLGAAIYLSEYARPRVRRVVKPILEILAGVPSVVLGFFALTWITPNLVQRFVSDAPLFNALAAAIGVGILVTPLMASITEDALRAVPQELREASFGLGARRRSTVTKVVLPAAVSGIVAALIISVSRAIGETMIVTIAAGGSGGALFSVDPLGQMVTLTAAIANLATGTDAVAGQGGAFESLYFVGVVLFAFTFLLNLLGDRIVRRYRKDY